MEQSAFKERVKRLKEVNKVISELDPAIKTEAFLLLQGYVTGETRTSRHKNRTQDDHESDPADQHADLGALITQYPPKKPADAARLLAGYFFSQYGNEPFSLDEIRDLATEAGLTIPDRLNMTLNQSRKDSKSLFRSKGRGLFQPTVTGQTYFQDEYGLKPGRKKRSADETE